MRNRAEFHSAIAGKVQVSPGALVPPCGACDTYVPRVCLPHDQYDLQHDERRTSFLHIGLLAVLPSVAVGAYRLSTFRVVLNARAICPALVIIQ